MTEERIVETRTPDGETRSTHTTIVTDGERSGGGGKWVLLLIVLIVAIVGIWAVSQFGGAEVAKDNAIADAASEVGDAAGQVGDAAQDAADGVGN